MDNEYIKKYCSQCQTEKGHQSSKKNPNSNIENGLCKLVIGSDGLPIRCVGDWGLDKINYIERYFEMFTISMNKKPWENINYIEICSGPGVCVYRDSVFKEKYGSALTIIKNKGFDKTRVNALFIDKEETVVNALNMRINKLGVNEKAKAVIGDYTDKVNLIKIIKNNLDTYRALNMIVIDPTDCSVPFKTVEYILTQLNQVDVIINFAFGTDLTRNIVPCVKGDIKTDKYKLFLCSNDFFNRDDIKKLANENKSREILKEYYLAYENKLKNLGYNFTDNIPIKNYYSLIFATRHKLGLNFWKKAQAKDSKGQANLNFD